MLKTLNDILDKKKDVVVTINQKGARTIKKKMRENYVSIFLMPKSLTSLKERLIARGTEEEVIKGRLKVAEEEIKKSGFYDYTVINDDLDQTISDVRAIMTAERLKTFRR